MGSNSSLLQSNIYIQFTEDKKVVYQAGEIVGGIVQFGNDVNIVLKRVLIELIGEVVYTEHKKKGKSVLTTTNRLPFLTKRILLYSSNEKNELLSSKAQLPFHFRLDNCLPSSFEQIQFQGSVIHYFIRISCLSDQSHDAFKREFPIIVQRCPERIKGNCFDIKNANDDNVQLNLISKTNLAVIGQHFPLNLSINNPNRLRIRRISLTLVQIQKLGPLKEERIVLFKENLKNFEGEHWNDNIKIDIPYGFRPSSSHHLILNSISWRLFLQYEICVKVHLTGLHKNIHSTIPIIVTNRTETINEKVNLSSTSNSLIFNTEESHS